VIVVSGAIAPAQAGGDKKSVTLFTPRDHADHFICGAVNVSSVTVLEGFRGFEGSRT
jgi:hypothetical protein